MARGHSAQHQMPRTVPCLAVILLIGCAVAVPAQAEEAPRMLLLGLSHDDSIDDADARLIIELLGNELAKDSRFDLLTENELRRFATLAAEQQTVDCQRDAACVAELAGALHARFLVGGSIGRLGSDWVIALQVTDTQSFSVLARTSSTAPSAETLRARLPDTVRRLREFEHPALPPSTRTFAIVVALAGAGGPLVGAGLAAWGTVLLAEGQRLDEQLRQTTDADNAATLRADRDAARQVGLATLVPGVVVGVGAVATGMALFFHFGGLE